ncbi:MAG: rRNA pseudouridine synthase [Ruminococcaceae bacterium]|nr:rRNA pseudouridine synthase [Oscillospiraceae bacterium]
MRLDRFLSECAVASRSESKKAVRRGEVFVNGLAAKAADMAIDPEGDSVTYRGSAVIYRRYTYIMLNKPDGVVSATDDKRERTVLDLLPAELRKKELFPCGRLDKNTLGLMLITDNGELAHKLLSPKNHVEKKYRFRSKFPVKEEDAERFRVGVTLDDGYVTKPAEIELLGDGDEGIITLHEGKYHQIKRMLDSLGNKITYLERVSFANLTLDRSLERGEWRYLTDAEKDELEKIADIKAVSE